MNRKVFSDKEIWDLFIKGEENAMELLYEHFYVSLINYGRFYTKDKDIANDYLIDLILYLWRKRKTLSEVKSPLSYLQISLRRLIFAKTRQQEWEDIVDKDLPLSESSEPSYEDHIILMQNSVDLQQRLASGFNKLTQRQRDLLIMKFYEDRSYDEIANNLKITKRTAYNLVHRALKTLQDELGNVDGFDPNLLIWIGLSTFGLLVEQSL